MNGLTFDDEKHEYRFNGVIVPSVTQIISGVGLSDYSHIPAETIQRAQERGSIVHRIIELYELGELDESTIDPALRGYFDSYLAAKEFGLLPEKPSAVEKRMYSANFKYAGTIDQIYGEEWINDLKTGEPQPEIVFQLSGYWVLWHENLTPAPRRLTGTYLHEDGSPADVIDYQYKPLLWSSALSVYRWMERNGRLRKGV